MQLLPTGATFFFLTERVPCLVEQPGGCHNVVSVVARCAQVHLNKRMSELLRLNSSGFIQVCCDSC